MAKQVDEQLVDNLQNKVWIIIQNMVLIVGIIITHDSWYTLYEDRFIRRSSSRI